MIRLVSTDFDGTIYDSSTQPSIAPEFIEKLRLAQKDGVKWVINTGRDLTSLLKELELLEVSLFPDFIVSVERQIHERRHDQYYDHTHWNAACHKAHKNLFLEAKEWLDQIRHWIQQEFNVQLYEDLWSPLCIIASSTDADHIHRQIEKECCQITGLSLVRNGDYFRFGHEGYSKGTALSEIARLLKVPKEKIFAAGDHYNDLSMLNGTHAGKVAAPVNAIDEVKQIVTRTGGFLAERTCSFGILDALKFFERK